MDAESWDVYVVVDLFLLLLIGIGPKIALVPFLEATKGMDEATKALVTRKMLGTAATVAVILVVLGELLRRLLHFSTGALSIAGGLVLVIIAVSMIISTRGNPNCTADCKASTQHSSPSSRSPSPTCSTQRASSCW